MSAYVRIHPACLQQSSDHRVFESVANHLIAQGDPEALSDVPLAAETARILWLFAGEVAGSGLPDYLLNHCSSIVEADRYLTALRAVGAGELVEIFEALIPLAGDVDPFAANPAWVSSFSANSRWPTLESAEWISMTLAADHLSGLVAKHVRAAADAI
ncbi:MAG TPA: hypothetical protein VFL14_06930 [Xanthomonadales bacterium]|nr:hypothetical protein [Xanthomonadales bacterium]